jgi:hypothetical protein
MKRNDNSTAKHAVHTRDDVLDLAKTAIQMHTLDLLDFLDRTEEPAIRRHAVVVAISRILDLFANKASDLVCDFPGEDVDAVWAPVFDAAGAVHDIEADERTKLLDGAYADGRHAEVATYALRAAAEERGMSLTFWDGNGDEWFGDFAIRIADLIEGHRAAEAHRLGRRPVRKSEQSTDFLDDPGRVERMHADLRKLGTRDADQSAPAAKEPGERQRHPSAGMTPDEGAAKDA